MSPGRILIVEDDKDLNNVYAIILKHAGHEVNQVYNGQQALAAIKSYQPSVILLDIFMPVMDGKTFLQNLDLDDYPGTRVIVCSNTSDAALMDEMLSLGADKVVTKSTLEPSDVEALVEPYLA